MEQDISAGGAMRKEGSQLAQHLIVRKEYSIGVQVQDSLENIFCISLLLMESLEASHLRLL